jgi:hypothetical protein
VNLSPSFVSTKRRSACFLLPPVEPQDFAAPAWGKSQPQSQEPACSGEFLAFFGSRRETEDLPSLQRKEGLLSSLAAVTFSGFLHPNG